MTNGTPATWQTFVEESRAFIDAGLGSPLYGLIETVEELYRAALAKAALPETPTDKDNLVLMCFLICSRALLSAATSTASGLPEDGAAVTRRALEAAKVALAITIDPANVEEWRALNKRTERWEDRRKGVKPKGGPISPQYKGLSTETLYEDLTGMIAMLSDYTVHFTPEYVLAYEWQMRNKDGATEVAFSLDESDVPHDLLMLVEQHRLILRVFDRCFDGKLYRDAAVRAVAQTALAQYKEMLAKEGLAEELTNVGDEW